MNHKRAVKKLMGIGVERNRANFCLRWAHAGGASNAEFVNLVKNVSKAIGHRFCTYQNQLWRIGIYE